MFYAYVEKQSNSIWGGWETRLIAFDTLRRYLYYTAPITQPLRPEPSHVMTQPTSTTATGTVTRRDRTTSNTDGEDEASLSSATRTRPVTATTTRGGRQVRVPGSPRTPLTVTSNNSRDGDAAGAVGTSVNHTSEPPRRSNSVPTRTGRNSGGGNGADDAAADDDDAAATEAATLAVLQSVKWKRKLKLLAVVPVATIQRFVLDDVHLCERDFFQLEFTGENRAMATGECPPPGPLLCPSTGIPRAEWWAPTMEAEEAEEVRNEGYNTTASVSRSTSTIVDNSNTTTTGGGLGHRTVSSSSAAVTRRMSGTQRGGLSTSTTGRLPQSASTPAFGAMAERAAAAAAARQRAREWEEKMDAAVEDVHQLAELYNALRMQFDELNYERRRAAHIAVANGRRPPPPPLTQTLSSPLRNYDSVFPPARKHITVRCRNEYELRRLWYVVQMVLGYDKLDRRPYWGLPPYDPRNGLLFGHVPMLLWHNFDTLDKAVFYTFIRGDLLGMDEDGKLEACVRGAYLCITHDTVLFMRDTGTIPCWIRLKQVCGFEYNCHCDVPFVVFRSDPPSPDVLFVPRAPAYGHDAIAHYNPRFDVRRIHYVMQELCFSSMCIRRVIQIKAVADHSAQAYAQRVAATGQPLCVYPGAGRQTELRALLPKERLASVWQQVQRDLRARGEAATNAAIPLYESTAAQLRLRPEQLHRLERVLDEERDSLDDVVGIPLQRAQELRPEPFSGPNSHAATHSQRSHHHHRHRHHTQSSHATTTPYARSSRRGSQDRSSDTASTAVTSPSLVTPHATNGSGGGIRTGQLHQSSVHESHETPHTSHRDGNGSSSGGAVVPPHATTLTRASSSVLSLPASVGPNAAGAEQTGHQRDTLNGGNNSHNSGDVEPLYTQLLPRSQSHSVTDVPQVQPAMGLNREGSTPGRLTASSSEANVDTLRVGSHIESSSSSHSSSSSSSSGSDDENGPDYVVPGARYITEDELRAGTAPFDATALTKEQHTVIGDNAPSH